MIDPNTQLWFHGRISREQSERLLKATDCRDGTYLLRESTSVAGCFVLSVCFNARIIHYQIQRKGDGTVGIEDGPRFPGPVELVLHHEVNLDGLLTRLTSPCTRPHGVSAKAFQNVSHDDLVEATRQILLSEGIENEEAISLYKEEFEQVVGNILHKKQSWFHGVIPRDEADRRLESQGCDDGLFLIRERATQRGSYVLGLCFKGKVYHYLFDPNGKGKLSIKSGRLFDNLMQVVEYYSHKSDGLLCKLVHPCNVSYFQLRARATSEQRNILLDPDIQSELKRTLSSADKNFHGLKRPQSSGPSLSIPLSPHGGRGSRSPRSPRTPPSPLSPTSPFQYVPPVVPPHSPGSPGRKFIAEPGLKYEKIYDSPKMLTMDGFHSPFRDSKEPRTVTVDSRNLLLEHELGRGNFGSVMKGTYILPNNKRLQVAVKTLKEEDIPNQKSEIMHEAEIMSKLDHPNIVRMIGITGSNPMMLVMELAAQGPLHKYLKSHKDMPILGILILMLQVDEGMQYLESQHFVHRDLAARNVLVVSENFVKISDFGMSRAMGVGNEYYRAERAGKWPLKWYAPECVYYFKFTSKSDVWSYGITMWESLSYGTKPYHGMKGPELMDRLEDGYRLPPPAGCPPDVYKLMKKAWEYNPEDRPTFVEIGQLLSVYIEKKRKGK